SATTQADLDALRTLFNEDAGLVYLRCTDGAASPKTWRCAIRQLAPPQRVDVARFKIPLRAANPVWEEDTLTTDTKANQSGNSVAINLTNNGNRAARPKFTLTPNAVKTSTLDDYKFSFRGVIVPRTPGGYKGPIYLLDRNGAQARIATDTSASGGTVKQTLGQTTLNGALGASDTTITLTSVANWAAGGGIGYITD